MQIISKEKNGKILREFINVLKNIFKIDNIIYYLLILNIKETKYNINQLIFFLGIILKEKYPESNICLDEVSKYKIDFNEFIIKFNTFFINKNISGYFKLKWDSFNNNFIFKNKTIDEIYDIIYSTSNSSTSEKNKKKKKRKKKNKKDLTNNKDIKINLNVIKMNSIDNENNNKIKKNTYIINNNDNKINEKINNDEIFNKINVDEKKEIINNKNKRIRNENKILNEKTNQNQNKNEILNIDKKLIKYNFIKVTIL